MSLEHDSHVWSSHESANSEEIMRFVLWSMWWDSIFQWQIEGLTVQISSGPPGDILINSTTF